MGGSDSRYRIILSLVFLDRFCLHLEKVWIAERDERKFIDVSWVMWSHLSSHLEVSRLGVFPTKKIHGRESLNSRLIDPIQI